MASANIGPFAAIGDRFGRWTVKAAATPKCYGVRIRRRWQCLCDCGVQRDVAELSLHNGSSQSCGCLARERSSEANAKHGHAKGHVRSPEYEAWRAMLARCRNPNDPRFADYGGRGIGVAAEWVSDFGAFLNDMGPRPSSQHSIDRIDNDAGYEPGNCAWRTAPVQMVNRRNTRFVEIDGQSVPLATLAKRYAVPANTLRARIVAGWPVQDALTTPVAPRRKRRRRT